MSQFDCNEEMAHFHDDEVVLSGAEQKEMRDRRDAGRTRLKTGLQKADHPAPDEFNIQGSYAMRTMVQDNQCDYDIDDGAYFDVDDLKDGNGQRLGARQARIRVRDALADERLAYDAVVKTNCVRQKYPNGYHIDIPVYRVTRSTDVFGNPVEKYELASGETWVESDARAVTRWFNAAAGKELKSGEADYSQLRRVTRLTKKMARSRVAWKAKTTSGICISKLVVDHFQRSSDHDDVSLRDTWEAVSVALAGSLAIAHPVLPGKQLADEGDKEVQFFRDCLSSALKTLEALDDFGCTRTEARKAWDSVFKTSYFSDRPGDDGEKASVPFIITSTKAADRQDGGRRFG